ncbi:MAG: hypothetical protein ACRBDL_09645 [Alphaproteobacteria bacterium]
MNIIRKATGFSLALSKIKKSPKSRRQRLLDIITHANNTTPFYKGTFDAFLSHAQSLNDEEFFYAYRHLPIVEKQNLKDQNDSFMSNHLHDKVDLLADGKTPTAMQFIKHALIKKDFFASLSTGGTSGIPTYRWIDYDDANLFAQSFLHSFKLNGWSPGESFVVYYPLKSYFTGAYADQAKALQRYFGFTMVPFETVTKESALELLETLKKNKSTLLVIFPCVLQRIAEIMYRENIPPFTGLPYINVSGEFFLDCSKSFIQTMFPDSDIQSTYGAVEFGEIAHQKDLSSFDYDVFDDYAYLEQGPKNSILVTSYRQKAFPLIRYKIEDMGQVVTHDDGSQSIMNLEGKNTDYLVGADGYMYFASFFNQMVNDINRRFNMPIIHFMLRHDQNDDDRRHMQLNFVLKTAGKEEKIEQEIRRIVEPVFENYDHIDIQFPTHFEHDYTRKFKIIGEGDGQAEVVGGYYQRKAS